MNQVIVWGENEEKLLAYEAICTTPRSQRDQATVIYHWPFEEDVDGAGVRRLKCQACGETYKVGG